PNSLPERLTVFGPIMGWKSLCIMHLALYRNQSSPTDFPEEGNNKSVPFSSVPSAKFDDPILQGLGPLGRPTGDPHQI
ncbi:MAG: hypothetical protein M3461_13495, partial [Pseudomonadota bacterium]|nr:hypothetical protein [Pseudomonadota bacterium]